MGFEDVDDRLAAHGENVEPQEDGPETVLLADMVRAGAGAFLAAERRLAGVQEIAEELPAGRRLVAADAELFGDAVGGGAGRHRAGDAGKPRLVAGRQMGIRGEHREAVRRGHVDVAAEHHVAVAIAVRGRAEIRRRIREHQVHQVLRPDRIGVRVAAAEIR